MGIFNIPRIMGVLAVFIGVVSCSSGGGGGGSGNTGMNGDYRTVVIIGDTQSHVRGGSPRYADFQAQIQWIIDNKYTENIDFVMASRPDWKTMLSNFRN